MQKNPKRKINFEALQKTINYRFQAESLLVQALSHRSVGPENNERLEFLGDSLLNFFIAEALFKKFPKAKEGDLSRLRASLVKGETLAKVAQSFSLGEYLLLGSGELKSGGHRRESILADTVEALIGAIYLDSGMNESRDRTLEWYDDRLSSITLGDVKKDSKTQLQEFLQERKKPLPKYKVASEMGESHDRRYKIECTISMVDKVFTGIASSKRNAEKAAATEALSFLMGDGDA